MSIILNNLSFALHTGKVVGNLSAEYEDELDDRRKGQLVADLIHAKLIRLGVNVAGIFCLGGDSCRLNTGKNSVLGF